MQLFEQAIAAAWAYHNTPAQDFLSEVLDLLQSSPLDSAPAKVVGVHDDDGEGRVRCGDGATYFFFFVVLFARVDCLAVSPCYCWWCWHSCLFPP